MMELYIRSFLLCYNLYDSRHRRLGKVCRDLWRLGWDVADLAGGILNYRGKYIDKSPSPKLK